MFLALLFISLLSPTFAIGELRPLAVSETSLLSDLELIFLEAKLPLKATLSITSASTNQVELSCTKDTVNFRLQSHPSEVTATFYKGLRELGFLFPHPRWQLSPTLSELQKNCRQKKFIRWSPTLRYRGLHLHTLHPNEWVRGFFMDRPDLALEIIRWSARNGFNLLDVSLLRVPDEELQRKFQAPFALAKSLGVHTGVSLGVALHQQKSYKLLSLFQALTGWGASKSVEENFSKVLGMFDTSFVVLEAGTSEFTATEPEDTIDWLNTASRLAQAQGRVVLTKVHVSSNQKSEKFGNFNFLPQFADASVGILPHTVMFYGLLDERAPMYGNKNFHSIRDYMQTQNPKRPTWYYPETGYWVGMDVDVPLFLTDYLRTRAEDLQWLHNNSIPGQLIFSTGHALGGWLFDWTQALLTDSDYQFNPFQGLELLGEDKTVWQAIFEYQKHHFKDLQVIRMLSAANLQDELSETHRIHDRLTMKQMASQATERQQEIQLLRTAKEAWPETKNIKHKELQNLLTLTLLRLDFALALRESVEESLDPMIRDALTFNLAQAQLTLAKSRENPLNYADVGMWDELANPTGYQFGYIYPAASLYFWKREKRQIEDNSFWPFTGNMYNPYKIVFEP
jgi:hypothetical protein